MNCTRKGRLIGVGTGPGDPELLTLKAVRALAGGRCASRISPSAAATAMRAPSSRRIFRRDVIELPLLYPVTTEIDKDSKDYRDAIAGFYEESADRSRSISTRAEPSRCCREGDPLFYGSYMHLHVRLAHRFPTEVIPGVTAMSGCWSQTGLPIVQGDDVLTVLPGTMSEFELTRRLADTDAAVIMKVGRNLPKIRRALAATGQLDRADLCRARHDGRTRVSMRLADKTGRRAPYFSIVLVPGWAGQAMSGQERPCRRHRARARQCRPGDAGGRCAVAEAEFFFGYRPYLDRLDAAAGPDACRLRQSRGTFARPGRAGEGGGRRERSRSSRAAIPASSPWRPPSARRSRPGRREWRAIDVTIVPGVTAMLAVAARIGAPLGHDFCAISLSDNLKPWELIEQRLDAAAAAGFVIALYNPISKARPWQLGQAFDCLREILPGDTPVIFGRAAGRPDETHRDRRRSARPMPSRADMATCVIIGSPETRVIERGEQAAAGLHAALFARAEPMIDACAAASSTVAPDGTSGSAGRRNMITSMPSARAAAILP